jgi:hypothetical protein
MDANLHKAAFSKIDYCNALSFGIEDLKYVAFQLGQTLSLMDGIELYTKKSISALYPDLEPFMTRSESRAKRSVLNHYRDEILQRMKVLPYCKILWDILAYSSWQCTLIWFRM